MTTIDEMIDDLNELSAHFEDREDVDDNGNPNFAMKSKGLIDVAVRALHEHKRMREALVKIKQKAGSHTIDGNQTISPNDPGFGGIFLVACSALEQTP